MKITVEQQGKNQTKKTAEIIITQNAGGTQQYFSTLYQWGRKDALPGTNTFYPSNGHSFESDNNNKQGHSYGYSIQHPEKMLCSSLRSDAYYDWCNSTYINTWAINNTQLGNVSNDAVVKTIYDPCPANFHLPASRAFSGFQQSDQWLAPVNAPADGWDGAGWNFYTQPNGIHTTPTIYFPISGYRFALGGGFLESTNSGGYYWLAFPDNSLDAYLLDIERWFIYKMRTFSRDNACSVRPVADN